MFHATYYAYFFFFSLYSEFKVIKEDWGVKILSVYIVATGQRGKKLIPPVHV